MNSKQVVGVKLCSMFELYDELCKGLEPKHYALHLFDLPSNSIGQQLWCLGGARQSHREAIEEKRDFSWKCDFPYEDANDKEKIDAYLIDEGKKIQQLLGDAAPTHVAEVELLTDLLMHEVQHQGQLIRYIYGNRLTVPLGWKKQWSLD